MQSDRDDKAVFDNFPLELWFKVFSYFDIKTRLSLRFVNRNFEQVAIDDFFWKQRYQHHFSSDLPKVNGWYKKFRKKNKTEYVRAAEENHSLFFLVKENDSEKLKKKTILLRSLDDMDRQHETLLYWVQKMGNQDVLDHFYQIAVAAYSTNKAIDTAIADANNRTIFYWATACRQKDDELERLLARGCRLNAAYAGSQQQPIHIAAMQGYLGMMQYFLKKNPRLLNQRDATHWTPLFFAAANGQTAMTEFLLAQDGLEHNPLPCGTTALHLAAQFGHEDVVQILVEKYPSLLNQTNDHHNTPLMLAAENGHVAVVTYLLKQDAIDLDTCTEHYRSTTMNGMTALHLSIKVRKFNVTKHLIEAGANLTLTTERAKKQPIHFAAKKGSRKTLRALLKKNPDLLNQVDAKGKTPLMIAAATKGNTAIVAYLVKKPAVNLDACTDPTFYSANANKKHRAGMTALHFAAAKNNWRAVQMLIKAGANLTLPTTFTKKQPSHFAAEVGSLKAIKILLKKNPDLLNQRDANGGTPLIYAISRGYEAIVTYLLKQLDVKLDGAHQFTALHFAVYGTINVVKILLAKNTNLLNQVDGDGCTPLMHAARQGKSAIVKFLLQQDALTDVVANNRMTALQMAVGIGEIKIVKALLNKNPDLLNQTDDNGWTPLMRAAAMGKQRVVQHLLQQHDVTLDNMPHGFLEEEKNNETAFHLADKYGNETIINCFLKNKTMLDLLKSATFDRSKLSAATKAKLALLDYIPQRKKQPEYKRHLTFFCLPLFGLGYSRNEKLAAARELKEAVLNEKDLKDFANKREVHTGELGAIYRKIRQTM